MWKLLLFAGLIPLVASLLARKFFCDRVLRRYQGEKVSPTARGFAKAVLKCGEVRGVEIVEKRRPFLVVSPDQVTLSPKIVESKLAVDVAEAGIRGALTMMARGQEKVVAWRVWAVKFSSAFPVFTALVMIFALIMSRFSGTMAIGALFFAVGLGCAALWSTLTVEREAGKLVAGFLEEKAVVARRSEADLLVKIVRALSWKRILPGFFR